ncbi:hypothetical protein BB561_006963 [Smittium simulii]|uniref:Peptidase A2 domain-containing protein n=1 Tax=Smittium simulii TaxID=133385 RepID=A0A2T9XYY1_9FUNG|nr:hypothetical protein BB561_006963 [Smittium simulii]
MNSALQLLLNVGIEGTNVLALIDSGASTEIISKELLDSLSLQTTRIPAPTLLKLADGTTYTTTEQCSIKIKLYNQVNPLSAIVFNGSLLLDHYTHYPTDITSAAKLAKPLTVTILNHPKELRGEHKNKEESQWPKTNGS